ncbi:MAG TPA: PTS sugar transporter subunit IIA [Pirellulales bacterium]|jgi:PTS system nitrogen regulatory IIA component|nr:PTS sugar transporter subunit IIA [Pirellulales bacterium]
MADDDFDVSSLAAYLHLEAGQVARLVERGKLPGRRVAGGWRFSRPEVHQWLERRIGLSDEQELQRVEGALQAAGSEPHTELSLSALLPPEAIEIPLAARTRNSVIDSMVEVAARTGWLWDPHKMADAVRNREEMHPTALDTGVALLHPRRPLAGILEQAFLTFGRTEAGIPFGSIRLTDLFFLICSTDDRGHLHTLARLSRLISWPDFVGELRAAPDAVSVHELFERAEGELG